MKLSVFHNSIDLTLKMDDFTYPAKVINLSMGEIIIGFHKPIKKIYIELASRNISDAVQVLLYRSGAYSLVNGVEDRTQGLTKSGFISWPDTIQEKTIENGVDAYWIKLTTVEKGEVSINGINTLFSSDADFSFLKSIFGYLEEDQTSFVGKHQEARNKIVQDLRKEKIRIISEVDNRQLNQFDLLDIEELKSASKYYALHLIFVEIKTTNEDKHGLNAAHYLKQYEESMDSTLLTVDLNDDGTSNDDEKPEGRTSDGSVQSIRITRD